MSLERYHFKRDLLRDILERYFFRDIISSEVSEYLEYHIFGTNILSMITFRDIMHIRGMMQGGFIPAYHLANRETCSPQAVVLL